MKASFALIGVLSLASSISCKLSETPYGRYDRHDPSLYRAKSQHKNRESSKQYPSVDQERELAKARRQAAASQQAWKKIDEKSQVLQVAQDFERDLQENVREMERLSSKQRQQKANMKKMEEIKEAMINQVSLLLDTLPLNQQAAIKKELNQIINELDFSSDQSLEEFKKNLANAIMRSAKKLYPENADVFEQMENRVPTAKELEEVEAMKALVMQFVERFHFSLKNDESLHENLVKHFGNGKIVHEIEDIIKDMNDPEFISDPEKQAKWYKKVKEIDDHVEHSRIHDQPQRRFSRPSYPERRFSHPSYLENLERNRAETVY